MFFGQGFGKNYCFEFYSYGNDLYSCILHIKIRKNHIGHVFGNAYFSPAILFCLLNNFFLKNSVSNNYIEILLDAA